MVVNKGAATYALSRYLRRCRRGVRITAMGMVYLMFEMDKNDVEDDRLNIPELESMNKTHCLLLPYVLHNVAFVKQFAVVYDDWDMEGLNGKRNKYDAMQYCVV